MLAFAILHNLVSFHLEITTKFHQHNFSSQTTKSQKMSQQWYTVEINDSYCLVIVNIDVHYIANYLAKLKLMLLKVNMCDKFSCFK